MPPFRYVGKALPRKEDYRFLTGTGRYVDDIEIPGALAVSFVRSPHAHARIVSIDAGAARRCPGVVAVVTGADVAQWTTKLRIAPPIEGLAPVEMATLPIDKVRFLGDPVACVVARDRYLAEDAAEHVVVEYEPLDPVTDIWQALAPGAPRVDDALASNLVSHQTFRHGDPDARVRGAFKVVESTFAQARQTHLPIETRGCAAVWDEGRQHLTLHIGSQAPHPMRTQLAARLRLAESQVTVVSPDVGGAFGQKIVFYREELTVAALTRALKRPVRWREDRMENLLASSHAREDFCRTRAAVDRDGRLLSLTLELVEDFGAYCFFPANYLARVVAMILTGPYKVQDYALDVKVVLTNKCGNGPMRAPMAITSWVMEGTIDAIARALDLDPVRVRHVNMIGRDELPYTMPTGEVLEDVTPRETLDACLRAVDYTGFRARQRAERAEGKYRGVGICTVVESTTYGSRFYKSAGIPGSGHEAAWIRIEPSGAVNASVGLSSTGQGYETALAQVVAEGLGVDPGHVRVQLGNTDVAPYGMGSRGSRGGTAGGGTLYLCALDARTKMRAIAARLLEAAEADIELVDGVFTVAGTDRSTTFAEVARTAYFDPLALPDGMTPGLDFGKTYDPPPMTYSNATHICIVEFDAAIGALRVERYVVAEDCGTVMSPVVVEGQQHGAIAMGLGNALLERVVYDEGGQNLTGTLADYLVPTACDLPDFEIIPMHTPNRRSPAGIKGMAEGGVMGGIGALANAVNDALAPFRVVAERLPLTPEYLRALVRGKRPST